MGLRINNNIESMVAHRNLLKNDRALSKSLERLASGQKVNRAADDPAALVISEHMRSKINGMEQSIRNNEIAISLVQTAEGSMNEISSLLIGIRQRAISAANVGASDNAMTAASQAEIENALSSLDRIVSSTQFGHHKLLDGTNARKTLEDGTSKEGLRFQVGPDAGHTASISIQNMTSSQLGRVAEGEMPNASNFMSLADIDVSTEQGSQDALGIIDEAITEVATVRGELGAFQTNTLESNLTSLQIAAENMTSAESTLRDTDMAQELATFTRNQIMSQSATAQLAQANALPQNVLRLLNN
ncbi:MAG: flagellin [SAR324 cluster bacterium]|nr:flagellin [SAR324 cluster bacterium]